MPTCYRYLFTQLALPTLLAIVAFSGAVWLSQSLRFVDLIVNKGLPLGTFLYLTVLLFPSLLMVVLPFAVFVAVLFAYHRLSSESEFVVLRAAGISDMQIARPCFLLAAVLTIAGYALSLYLMPLAFRTFKDLQYEIRGDLSYMLLQEGVFNTPTDGVTVYVRERMDNGELAGILFHDTRDPKRSVTMMSERGRLVKGDEGPMFELFTGNRQERDLENRVSVLHFERYVINLAAATRKPPDRWRKPKERYLSELLWPGDGWIDQANHNKLIAEGHKRLTWPLNALTFALIAIAAMVGAGTPRESQWRSLSIAFGAAVMVLSLSIAATSLASRSLVFIPALYLIQILPLGISVGLIAGWWRWPRPRPVQGFAH